MVRDRLHPQEDTHSDYPELRYGLQNTIVTDLLAHPPSAMATPTSAKPNSIAQLPAR